MSRIKFAIKKNFNWCQASQSKHWYCTLQTSACEGICLLLEPQTLGYFYNCESTAWDSQFFKYKLHYYSISTLPCLLVENIRRGDRFASKECYCCSSPIRLKQEIFVSPFLSTLFTGTETTTVNLQGLTPTKKNEILHLQ